MKGEVIVNLKTYKNGKFLMKMVKEIERVNPKIIVCAQATDISEIRKNSKLKILAQHVDSIKPGRNTGFVTAESVKSDGAFGVLINHSEHPLSTLEIGKTVKRCKEVKLKTYLFAKDLKNALMLKKFKPDFIAIEPPELVASKKLSVSSARPDLIKNVSKKLNYPFLVGAGVKSNEDYKIAIKFGAKGILLSSAVTTSKNPSKVLRELIG